MRNLLTVPVPFWLVIVMMSLVNISTSELYRKQLIPMKNVEMSVDKNDILTIKVDLKKEFGPSSSGKTLIIGSSEGNVSIPDNDEIKVGLNVYKKR